MITPGKHSVLRRGSQATAICGCVVDRLCVSELTGAAAQGRGAAFAIWISTATPTLSILFGAFWLNEPELERMPARVALLFAWCFHLLYGELGRIFIFQLSNIRSLDCCASLCFRNASSRYSSLLRKRSRLSSLSRSAISRIALLSKFTNSAATLG